MLVANVFGAILRVSGDGTQDYVLIQTAIAQSHDGDTVLVYPGRYIENLSLMGKNITLASLELTTGNPQYKHSTIIDGNQNGSVIIVQNGESEITIRGFTITNGSGFFVYTFGMTIGGGIQIGGLSGNRTVNLINNVICKNKSSLGGGLYIATASVFLSGTSIFDNIAGTGGGLGFEDTYTGQWTLTFDPVNRSSIYSNFAANGADIFTRHKSHIAVVVDTFTVAEPWNYYANADTGISSILNPYTFDILHTTGHQEINQDLYVAPWGNDDNSGTSPQDPFQTVFKAAYMIASDSQNPKVIHLAEGVYSKSLNKQILPAPLKSNTSIVGVSELLTIMDGDGQYAGFLPPFHSENISISQMSFRNARSGIGAAHVNNISFKNLRIHNLQDGYATRGILVSNSSNIDLQNISIENVSGVTSGLAIGLAVYNCKQLMNLDNIQIRNVFSGLAERAGVRALDVNFSGTININRLSITNCNSNNSGEFAFNSVMQIHGAPYVQRLKINISNSLFADNYQALGGEKLIHVGSLNDTLTIQNCTFTGNRGGSNILSALGTSYFKNNIFWNPEMGYEILLSLADSGQTADLHLAYNNIRGGSAGVINQNPNSSITWAEGNVNLDPMFRLNSGHPYSLLAASPLIDLGSPDADVLDLGVFDVAANERFGDGNGDDIVRIDIGAYEYQNMPSPTNLMAHVVQNTVALSWEMPQSLRMLTAYRIYRDGRLRGEVSNPSELQYTDAVVISGTYSYHITAMYGMLESDPSEELLLYIEVVDVEDLLKPPDQFSLILSPNPFHSLSTLHYCIPKAGLVRIDMYNLKGQLVRSLVNETKSLGSHQVSWDGCDQAGNRLSCGIYFVRLQTNGRTLKSKVLKLR